MPVTLPSHDHALAAPLYSPLPHPDRFLCTHGLVRINPKPGSLLGRAGSELAVAGVGGSPSPKTHRWRRWGKRSVHSSTIPSTYLPSTPPSTPTAIGPHCLQLATRRPSKQESRYFHSETTAALPALRLHFPLLLPFPRSTELDASSWLRPLPVEAPQTGAILYMTTRRSLISSVS